MRVLVTGGLGFIGSAVVDACRAAGDDVVVLDALLPAAHGRGPDGGTAELPGYAQDWADDGGPPVRVVVGDVRDRAAVDDALDGVDAVAHLAAVVGLGVDAQDLPDFASVNDAGTAVLLAACSTAGIERLALASSMVVYGEGRYTCPEHGAVPPGPRHDDDLAAGRFEPPCGVCGRPLEPGLVGEDAPLAPRSGYAASKAAQEHYAHAWALETATTAWGLRYHNVYGPRMPRGTPYAGVAAIFRSALAAGRAPAVFEDGRQRRDFVHVTDVARATRAALLAAGPPGEHPPGLRPVNVASGEVRTVGDLAAVLARETGGPQPEVTGRWRAGDVRHVTADPARLAGELDVRAGVGFDDGVARFVTDPLREPAAG